MLSPEGLLVRSPQKLKERVQYCRISPRLVFLSRPSVLPCPALPRRRQGGEGGRAAAGLLLPQLPE
eukprot:363250-Chlamydomonas_euryale.AAC.1